MKSRIVARRPYPPKTIIIVDDGRLPQELLDMHKQRIDTIFAKQTEEYRNEQLNKVIMHDILFSFVLLNFFIILLKRESNEATVLGVLF